MTHHDAERAPRTRRRRLLWTLGVAAALVAALVLGAGAYAWHLNSDIQRVPVAGLSRAVPEGQPENILLVGSTTRCGLKVQNIQFGLCSGGLTGVNSDVVMIVHLVPAQHTVSLLSIPRDTFIPNARVEGANRIDAALVEGPKQLVAAIQDDFGIPIQHYVELNFDTFQGVVNALGGIRMYFPMPVYDAYSHLDVTVPGCRELDGLEALQVVRARHLQYKGPGVTSTNPATWPQETLSDLARIRRDHEFLRVLATKVAHNGLGNPITDTRIVSSVASQLQVDSGFTASDLVHLLLDFHSVNAYSVPQYAMPIAATTFGSYQYEGGSYGDIVFPVEPNDQRVIDRFLGEGAGVDTMTHDRLPAPTSVRVRVLNGTGDPGQGSATADALHRLGFVVDGIGDRAPVSTQAEETVVYYSGPAQWAAAQSVAESLTGYVAMDDAPSVVGPGAPVTVVTGTHFAVVEPRSATTPIGGSGTTTPAGFQPPSAAVQALAPWDPRSCTPSGGPGA